MNDVGVDRREERWTCEVRPPPGSRKRPFARFVTLTRSSRRNAGTSAKVLRRSNSSWSGDGRRALRGR